MASARLKTFLQKILSPIKLISGTVDTVTVDENGIHNIISIERVMLPAFNAQSYEWNSPDRDMHIANHQGEDGTDEYDARIMQGLLMQCKVKHMAAGIRVEYFV